MISGREGGEPWGISHIRVGHKAPAALRRERLPEPHTCPFETSLQCRVRFPDVFGLVLSRFSRTVGRLSSVLKVTGKKNPRGCVFLT